MIKLKDGRTELYQWDTGRILTVPADCSQVHYSNNVFGRSIDVPVTDGEAIVPDILLQTDKPLHVWAVVGTGENGYTRISKVFTVIRRNKPADYVYTPTEQVTLAGVAEAVATLEGRVERLEGIDGGIPEAPMDGKQYARQDGMWTEVQVGAGGGGDFSKTEAKALFETTYALFGETVFAEDVTNKMAAFRALINALAPSESDYDVVQRGSTLIISKAPAVQDGATLHIL